MDLHPEDAIDAVPLTQSFSSTMHGISVSYPEGWIARAATEPWTDCLYCTLVLSHPQIDLLHRPPDDDGLFLRIASQPIGESAPEDWVAAQMASDERCTTTEPIIVDGATGLGGGDTCLVAVVTTAGRGYHIDLFLDVTRRPGPCRSIRPEHGSRRSLPRCNCSPRTPSTEGRRPHRRSSPRATGELP